jgi:ribonucleoside-diphosphate reductase alpha chain
VPQYPRPSIPRQVSSTTCEVTVGGEGDIGTLTVSTVPGIGVVAVAVRVAKHGSTLAGLADATAVAVSLGLRAGAPANAFRGLDLAGLSLADLGELAAG